MSFHKFWKITAAPTEVNTIDPRALGDYSSSGYLVSSVLISTKLSPSLSSTTPSILMSSSTHQMDVTNGTTDTWSNITLSIFMPSEWLSREDPGGETVERGSQERTWVA